MFSRILIAIVRFYQLAISPWFPGSCRYHPTCSAYAIDAIRLHGPVRGVVMAAGRLARCHPWGRHGYDPVPEGRSSRHVPAPPTSFDDEASAERTQGTTRIDRVMAG